ncbi:hypothetical protein D3C87_1429130 [compost metagenome]
MLPTPAWMASMARIDPLWLLPRSTLGAPRMVGSACVAAARAVSRLIGNSLIRTPSACIAAMRWGLSSSWLAVGMPSSCARATSRFTRSCAPSSSAVFLAAASAASSRLMPWLPIMYDR